MNNKNNELRKAYTIVEANETWDAMGITKGVKYDCYEIDETHATIKNNYGKIVDIRDRWFKGLVATGF